jgi:hypothetical protein
MIGFLGGMSDTKDLKKMYFRYYESIVGLWCLWLETYHLR